MSDEEAAEECKKLGTKSALPKVITTMRTSLELISFFTTGADEVRQWTIRKGTKAPGAAGVIHTGMSSLSRWAGGLFCWGGWSGWVGRWEWGGRGLV